MNNAPGIYDDTPEGRRALVDYCRGRVEHDVNPIFFGDTLKNIFRLAGEPAPDLDDDEIYEYFPKAEVVRLAGLAEERLDAPARPMPHLRLVRD